MSIDDLLKEFRIYKVNIEGRNNNSIDRYESHIKDFCKDMNITNYETFINIKSQVIKDWIILQAEKGNNERTRNNKLSAIKEIYKYLECEKDILVDRNIKHIPLAKIKRKETKYVSAETMEQLIVATKSARTKAGIVIIKSTGVRFKEMIQITCSDIDRGFAVIIGKGGKERKIWFDPFCINVCKLFIDTERKDVIKKTGVDTDLLFINSNGKVLTRQSFTISLQSAAKKIGLYWNNEISPHKLRHGFITEKLNQGVPIQVVRDMVGHSSIQTTNSYAHAEENAVREAMLNNDTFYNNEKGIL